MDPLGHAPVTLSALEAPGGASGPDPFLPGLRGEASIACPAVDDQDLYDVSVVLPVYNAVSYTHLTLPTN